MSYGSTMQEVGLESTITALELTARAPKSSKCAVLTNDYGWFMWDETSTASQTTGTVYKVSDILTGRWLAVSALALDSEAVASALADVTGRVSIHKVRGMGTANVSALATFTVAGVDGLTYVEGDRIFLKNQTTGAENGIYVVGVVGGGTAPLTRATDWAAAQVIGAGTQIAVAAGTVNAGTWVITNVSAVTVATTTPTVKMLDLDAPTVTKNHHVRGITEANQANLAAFVVSNDGITYVEGDRILLAGQTTGAENGIYTVGAVAGTAPLTRAADWASGAVIPTGSQIAVDAGTLGAKSLWRVSNTGAVTVGTTAATFFPIQWFGVQALTGAGAILLTSPTTRFTSSGVDDALTLADGAASRVGQRKRIFHCVDGGNGLLTAGGSLHLGDSIATIKLNAVRDFVELEWNGTSWFVVADRGAAYT